MAGSCPVASSRPRKSARARAQLTDRELDIKLSIASSTDRLDLSSCDLTELPERLFELKDLQELSLAGNQLAVLPHEVSRLTSLQRLVLAGNWLTELPDELWRLTRLEGLWAHGNLLHELPAGVGELAALTALSFAGNALPAVPDSLTRLGRLRDLNLSGNVLTELPEGFCALTALTMLSLHGNALERLPEQDWEGLTGLREATLQGNQLLSLPDGIASLSALTELSIADNLLESLPVCLSGLVSLQKLHAYGNRLTDLPLGPAGLPALQPRGGSSSRSSSSSSSSSRRGGGGGGAEASWDADASRSVEEGTGGSIAGGRLSSLWLEGNPLCEAAAAGTVRLLGPAGTTRVGLDERQLVGDAAAAYDAHVGGGGTSVRRGIVEGAGRGYCKLQLGPGAPAGGGGPGRVLVVAFGSAPGLPNWGGVMRRVAADADPSEPRSSEEDGQRSADYAPRIAAVAGRYDHVLLLGDSMGASGALLHAGLGTRVMAFCPQVDLTTASIRPGRPRAWLERLQRRMQDAVANAPDTRVSIYTGTWSHDVAQAALLEHLPNVHVKVYSVESHRLALALARQQKLAPLVREAIMGELGAPSGNVRYANLL